MEKTLLLGLKVMPPKEGFPVTTDFPKLNGLGGPRFEFVIAKGTYADANFFTSPGLREVLKRHPKMIGKVTGAISYSKGCKQGKELYIYQDIKPFDKLSKTFREEFKGKGIGEALEHKTLNHIIRGYGKITILPSESLMTPARLKQLASRRIASILEGKKKHEVAATDMQQRINWLKRKRKRNMQALRRGH